MLVLALAFGFLQAGVMDQSLFNPAYDRYDFQHPAHVAGLGLSAYYLLAFTIGHVVASIGVPIALVESYAARRGTQPWLGRLGLCVVAVLYVLGSVVNHFGVKEEEHFQASAGQVGFILAVVIGLVVVAFRIRPRPPVDGRVPPPVVVGGIAAVAAFGYLALESWLGVAVGVAVVATVATLVGRWSRRRAWTRRHPFAVAAGAALAGAVTPFVGEPYDDTVSASTELANDLVAAVIPVLLVAGAAWRLRRLEPANPA